MSFTSKASPIYGIKPAASLKDTPNVSSKLSIPVCKKLRLGLDYEESLIYSFYIAGAVTDNSGKVCTVGSTIFFLTL